MFKTLCFCLAASLVACSTTGTQTPATARTAVAACPPNATASRIPQRANECSASPVRTYSQEDVERTGQPNVADALPMLDPAISVHH
jgi:outer membrane cobalamin receptor